MLFARILSVKKIFLFLALVVFSQLSVQAIEKSQVDAIFRAKCMDCHSNETVLPWYAELPIAKQLIANDINKGRAFFDLAKEFFAYEDLESLPRHVVKRLEHEIKTDSMPPMLYRLGHMDRIVSQDEKKLILDFLAGVDIDDDGIFEALPKKESIMLDQAKVDLGNKLYHDKRLSGDNTLSCASCHDLGKGGTDQSVTSLGINGHIGPINSPTTLNAVYNIRQFWDGRAKDLEEQAHGPVHNPGEMGSNWQEVIAKLEKDDDLMAQFKNVFGTTEITGDMIANSIAEFEKSLITPNSRFDRYLNGDEDALLDDEKHGMQLFKQNCTSCHYGPALGGKAFKKMGVVNDYFADRAAGRNGMKKLAISDVDAGLYNFSKKETEKNHFKVPVLRNIELTFPYFHDGSINSLEKAVEYMSFYQNGIKISNEDRDAIVAFLKTLTDEDLR